MDNFSDTSNYLQKLKTELQVYFLIFKLLLNITAATYDFFYFTNFISPVKVCHETERCFDVFDGPDEEVVHDAKGLKDVEDQEGGPTHHEQDHYRYQHSNNLQ